MANDELQKLLKEQEALSKRIQETRIKHRDAGIQMIKETMSELGITAEMLGFYAVAHVPASTKKHTPTFKPRKVFGPVEPKYRDPKTGSTWSGRGKAPHWLGDNRDEYLIKDKAA
jgi:DNA-binding protein H-NS